MGEETSKSIFSFQIIIDYYLSQCRPLIAAGIRTLVFETIPTLKEVECVGKVLDQLGPEVRAWIVSTCQVKGYQSDSLSFARRRNGNYGIEKRVEEWGGKFGRLRTVHQSRG